MAIYGLNEEMVLAEARNLLSINPALSEKEAVRQAISKLKKSKMKAAYQRKLNEKDFLHKQKIRKDGAQAAKALTLQKISAADAERRKKGLKLPPKKASFVSGGDCSN